MPSIKNRKNGYRVFNGFMLRRMIIKSFKNKEKTIKLGVKSQEYVKNNFFPEIIMPKWKLLRDNLSKE